MGKTVIFDFPEKNRSKRALFNKIQPYIFLIPALTLLVAVYLYPLFDLVRTSFYDSHTLTGLRGFVGFANYKYLLSKEFLDVLWKTLMWVGLSTPAAMLVGLAGALLLNHDFKGKNFLKLLAFLPWTIPHAMIAVFWRWLIHPYYGMVNYLLITLGLIQQPVNFLSVQNAMYTAVGMRVWKGAPFAIVTLLAALQTIPKELYESAEVDGANSMRKFVHITFPMIKGVFLTTSLMICIWAVVTFDMLWVLTEGGPLGATEILPIAVYKKAFFLFNAGEASAMGVVGVILVALLGVFYVFLFKRSKE